METRLSEKTLKMAQEALLGKWGKMLKPTTLRLTKEEFEQEPSKMYAACVRHIAEEGDIRITPDELVIGATTLKDCTCHVTPVLQPDRDEPAVRSVSHVTLDFATVVKIGLDGLRRHAEERLSRGDLTDPKKINFLEACLQTLDAFEHWHTRYMELLDKLILESDGEQRAHYEKVRKYAQNVPMHPATNFREAVQSLMFQFAFQRQCGNWPGIGRIDLFLGDYLKKDLADGSITLDEAREYLAHFWIKGCEWVGSGEFFDGSGDGQHYQNIILSGVDTDGNDVENEVTFLVLDVVEETRISDFPIAVRLSKRSSEKLFRRVAEVQRLGTGTVAIYNNDFIIKNLVDFGYDIHEARNFANDGCWEIQVPGATCFTYHPYDVLLLLDETLGVNADKTPEYPSFDDLYAAWFEKVRAGAVDIIENYGVGWGTQGTPNTMISLFINDCIERAAGYYDRGARYTVYSPHASGLPNVINSLFAIKKYVYEEKKLTLDELVGYLRLNWEGHEDIRRRILKDFIGYGNADPEIDEFGKKVLHDYSWFQREVHSKAGVLFPAGASTFGREIGFKDQRSAQADGHLAHEILAANITPTPGSDKNGPTAIIQSLGALDMSSLVNGTALDMKLAPSSVKGEDGINAMVGLYKTFIDVGGIFVHIDVVDNKTLLDARDNPDKYPTLAVRVSGWSARFVTLNRDWQEMVIKKSMQTRC